MNKRIKIGTNIYDIEYVNKIGGIFSNLFSSTNGQINLPYDKIKNRKINKIFIKNNEEKQLFTLYHEIAHGICDELSKKYKDFESWNDDEKFIDYFASKLMTCFDIKYMEDKNDRSKR